MRRRGLGRGLDVLLGDQKPLANVTNLAVTELKPGMTQPRLSMNEKSLSELAGSIKAQGLMQPIIVRKSRDENVYEIIAGERRWRAAKLAGLETVPVVVKNVDNKSALAMALIENLQREDLSAMEEATGISKLVDEYSLTHEQAATILGKSRVSISNLIRLLSSPAEVKKMLQNGFLEQGHVRALLSLEPRDQIFLAQTAVAKSWSVRQVEKEVNIFITRKTPNQSKVNKSSKIKNADLSKLESELSSFFNLNLKINPKTVKSGELLIKYSNLEELESFLFKVRFKKVGET